MTSTSQAESVVLELEPRATQHQPPAPITTGVLTPMQLLQLAVARGADIDQLERLYALHQRFMADEAKNAFVADMAEFKKNPPVILKTKHVYFESRNGGSATDYWHAKHSDVTLPIVVALAQHGFSHDWEIDQKDGHVHVTCVITHRLGHSKRVHMFAAPDTSGNKNGAQAIASTKTLFERYTLLAATGLSTHDLPDDDGRGGAPDIRKDASNAANDPPFDTDGTGGAAPPPPPTEYYPQDRFDRNASEWLRLITSGEKAADRLIAFIESRGMPLTPEQRKTLLNASPRKS